MNIDTTRKLVVFALMMILNFVFLFGTARAQPQKGLLSRLIEIKYSSELYLSTALKNETNIEKRDSALAVYNTMRWKVDGWVYQLSSDMITANSTRPFK